MIGVSLSEPQSLAGLVQVCAASFTGGMATQSFTYHAHGTADSDKSCCYSLFKSAVHAHSGSPPDDKSYSGWV